MPQRKKLYGNFNYIFIILCLYYKKLNEKIST